MYLYFTSELKKILQKCMNKNKVTIITYYIKWIWKNEGIYTYEHIIIMKNNILRLLKKS